MDFQLNFDSETIGHLAISKPFCAPSNTTLLDALRLMQKHRKGSVLIVEDDRLVGLFTERDALRRMAANQLEGTLAEAMTAKPVVVTQGDSVKTAIQKMASGGYRRLPVVDDQGRPQGVLKVSAILHYLVEHFPETIYNLPPDPQRVPQQREGA